MIALCLYLRHIYKKERGRMMDFARMLKIQSGLDNYIGESKAINMGDYKTERIIALQVEFNELINELPFIFKYWKSKPTDRERALEEYVDGIHFILSIGNDFNVSDHTFHKPIEVNMQKLVFKINHMISVLDEQLYPVLVDNYLFFGMNLGFTNDEVEKAYMDKNKVNYERQDNGY